MKKQKFLKKKINKLKKLFNMQMMMKAYPINALYQQGQTECRIKILSMKFNNKNICHKIINR